MESEEYQNRTAFFYADESLIEIEGKRHLVLGAIATRDPGKIAQAITSAKAKVGLKPLNEIKWNMKGLSEAQRISLSSDIIEVISRTGIPIGVITILEGTDKQLAATMLTNQIIDCCTDIKIPTFILNVDVDLAPRMNDLEEMLCNLPADKSQCLGFQSLRSRSDQMIQCCDIFLGLYIRAILDELRGISKDISFYDDLLEEEIQTTLSEYILLSTRYLLWGSETVEIEELPFKQSMGTGLRIESTISEDTYKIIKERVAMVYMGCLH
jgi:hypothetical protein